MFRAKVCPKHVELILEINKTIIVASRWFLYYLTLLFIYTYHEIISLFLLCNSSFLKWLLKTAVINFNVPAGEKETFIKIKQRSPSFRTGLQNLTHSHMLCWVMQINELKTESNIQNEKKMCSHISKFKPGKTEFRGPDSY